jgi:hypothetical protein
VISADSQPIWPGELTAWGTLAVAVVAVAVALFAEWRAGVRVAQEREHSARVLADERKAADDRLAAQLAASEAQLRAERDEARKAAQESDAWAVQVDLSDSLVAGPPGLPPGETKVLLATVTNNGTRALGRVRVKFSSDGSQRSAVKYGNYVPRYQPEGFPVPLDTIGQPGVLAPGGIMQFESDTAGAADLTAPEVIVRWRDPYGQEWQHRHGHVTRQPHITW